MPKFATPKRPGTPSPKGKARSGRARATFNPMRGPKLGTTKLMPGGGAARRVRSLTAPSMRPGR